MKNTSLLVFDIDGTLLQTHTVTVPAVQRAFASLGLTPPAPAAICSYFGRPVEEYESWLASLCGADQASVLISTANALELRLMGEAGMLYPEAVKTLEILKSDGFEMAICSNGPTDYVDTFMCAHDMTRFFDTVYARGKIYRDKVEMVGRVLEKHRPDRFAVIGDRQDDMEAAHAWKGSGIAAAYGYGNEEERARADRIINAITDLPACLLNLWPS